MLKQTDPRRYGHYLMYMNIYRKVFNLFLDQSFFGEQLKAFDLLPSNT